MRELVTTALDVLGLLLVAAGTGFASARAVGPAGFAVSGGVVLAGSWWAARQDRAAGKGASG